MNGEFQELRHELFDYGWIGTALLLLALSLVPFLLPMADAIPKSTRIPNTAPSARPHKRVVLILIDGLGYRKAVDPSLMPHLSARMRNAAAGKALASFPTITPSGLRSILGGHRTVSEQQAPTGMRTSAEPDSILARASKAGLRCFAIGQFTWPALFPNGDGAEFTEVPHGGIEIRYEHGRMEDLNNTDQKTLDAAEPVVSGRRGPWDFLVLHFFEPDGIGHSLGTAGGFYPIHLRWLDGKIEDLSRRIEDQRPTRFLLLADHGQADDGTHGGMTTVEREVPFVIWGADVRPGDLGTFPLYDAAPTLAAMLGVAPPALSEGWPRLEALRIAPRERAAALEDLLRQRLARWEAVKEAYPWIVGDPEKRLAEIDWLNQAGNFAVAANIAEQAVSSIDGTTDRALPSKWLWRIIASMWALVLAAFFGLAWNQAEIKTAKLTGALSAACLLFLLLPMLRPSHWALTSGLVLTASCGVMVLALWHGLGRQSGLAGIEWGLWWIALLAVSFVEIVDISLWTWLMLTGLAVVRCLHLTKQNVATTALALFTVAVCAVLVSGMQTDSYSLARSLFPDPHWTAMEKLPWHPLSAVLFGLWAIGSGLPFLRSSDGPRSWTIYAWVIAPAVCAEGFMWFRPTAAAASWVVGGVSLAALVVLRPAPEARGMWLSALLLAYYRTLADDRAAALLVLAVVFGWALAWRSRDAHPLWEGLALLAIGFWAYKLSGSYLSFSHITVSEGNRVLGGGWHPYLLAAVLTLRPLAAIGAPIMPRLSIRPLYSVLGVLPLLGALSAGDLTMLWWGRFMAGNSQKFSDSAEFARTEFVLILAWLILGLWAAARAVAALSDRLARLRRV